MFNQLTISITFAPAIVFQNIIVCGQAIEVNFINDLVVILTTNDLQVLNKLQDNLSSITVNNNVKKIENNFSTLSLENSAKKFKNSIQKLSSNVDQFDSDSGFKSNRCNNKTKIFEKSLTREHPIIPKIFSFVGGIFTFEIFNSNTTNDSLEPLITVCLQQPNIFTRIDNNEQVRRACLYDISVNLHIVQPTEKSEKIFDENFIDTQRGETSESGIMPPLIEFKETKTKNEIKVICSMRKSLQLNVQPQSVEKLMSINEIMSAIFTMNNEITIMERKPIPRYNKIRKIRKLFGNVTSIEFNITRLTTKFITSKYSFLNVCLFKCDGKIRIMDSIEQIIVNINVDSVALNSENSMILNPASIEFDCILSQEKWDRRLIIVTNLQSNVFDLQISPTDIQTFAKVQVEFVSCFNRQSSPMTPEKRIVDGNAGFTEKVDQTKLVPISLPEFKGSGDQQDDQFFQDDLR